jgi:CubicO group peptidase (beta-lactamase class C family)
MTFRAALPDGLVPPLAAAALGFAVDGQAPRFLTGTAPGLRLGPDTYWRAASISKIVTGQVALAALVRAGLGADAAAGPLLGFDLSHPAAPGTVITAGMLAAHLAGLDDAGGYLVPPGMTLSDWVPARSGAIWTPWAPGHRQSYANLGYVLLAAIAERLTGRRFDHLAADWLARHGVAAGFNWSGIADRQDRMPIGRRGPGGFVPGIDATVAATGVSDSAGQSAGLSGWTPGTNPGVFSPQGGLRIGLSGALALGRILPPGPMLWQGDPPTAGDAGLMQAFGWGIMRLIRPDLYPRPLFGHFANAYGLVAGLWRDPGAGVTFVYLLNGLPEGDEDDALRPEEAAMFAQAARFAAAAAGDRKEIAP